MRIPRIANALRAVPALLLATTMLVRPMPVSAADPAPDELQPAARVQVILNSVHIWDDRDWGDGDIHLRFYLGCYASPTSCFGQTSVSIDHYDRAFSAGSGDTVPLNAVLPGSTDRLHPKFATPVEAGYALFPGHHYLLGFQAHEADDLTSPDDMGERNIVLQAENGWGIGQHSLRSTRVDSWGDFTINFEIRPVQLPDLRPVNIKVEDVPGSSLKRVCTAVQNVEPGDAGPFDVRLFVNGVVRPYATANVDFLRPGDFLWACGQTELPTSGQHMLKAVADASELLTEYNETNNVYEQTYTATSSTSAPTPSGALPDLTVSAIKVNGHAPDGKDDCREGSNDVTVVVKNGAATNVGDFYVRLVVDSGNASEKGLDDGLEAGAEREVGFHDVRLKKGPRSLAATADPTSGISESDEGNNALKVTARCNGDD